MSLMNPYEAAAYLPAGAPADYTDPWLEIDSAALAHNVRQIRAKTGNVPIMGVVKAKLAGKADMGQVSAAVKAALSS